MDNKIDIEELSLDLLFLMKPYYHTYIDYQIPQEDGSISTEFTTFGLSMKDKIQELLNKNLKDVK